MLTYKVEKGPLDSTVEIVCTLKIYVNHDKDLKIKDEIDKQNNIWIKGIGHPETEKWKQLEEKRLFIIVVTILGVRQFPICHSVRNGKPEKT